MEANEDFTYLENNDSVPKFCVDLNTLFQTFSKGIRNLFDPKRFNKSLF